MRFLHKNGNNKSRFKGILFIFALKLLLLFLLFKKRLGIPAEKIGDFGQTKNFRNGADNRQTCDATSKFRNIDGTCNNLVVPSYGKSGSIFSRLIVNSNEGYGDGRTYIVNLTFKGVLI